MLDQKFNAAAYYLRSLSSGGSFHFPIPGYPFQLIRVDRSETPHEIAYRVCGPDGSAKVFRGPIDDESGKSPSARAAGRVRKVYGTLSGEPFRVIIPLGHGISAYGD